MTDTVVEWARLPDGDKGWNESRCLYAYLAPHHDEILYFGKAWGVSVHGRWRREAKEKFWNDLERERAVHAHRVLIGRVDLPEGCRLSHELLCDVESLLIFELQPWGNIQSRITRTSRPGLAVTCVGDAWPLRRYRFLDRGQGVAA